ncbi:MAG: hypothetical protein ABI446_03355 [Gemmatimonadaceae bacterium]
MPFLQQQAQQSATDASVNATDLAAQIRAQVNQQLKQAGLSDQAAKSAADGAAQGVTGVKISKNGKTITIHTPGAPVAPVAPESPISISEDAQAPTSGTSIPPNIPLDIPPRLQDLGFALFLMIAVIAIGKPIVRVIGNIIERRAIKPGLPTDFGARLERIEQGIESVSIEVERISESQRYLLKVQPPTPDRMEIPRSAS